MLTKEQKRAYRADLFRQLDGIAVAPVAYTLYTQGVLEYILTQTSVIQLADLTTRFKANEGYLNVALRVLAAQGWLDYQVDNEADEVTVQTNTKSATAFAQFEAYRDVVELMKFSGKFHPRRFELEPFRKLERILKQYELEQVLPFSEDKATKDIQYQVLKHIEGVLVGPTVVLLGMGGMFHKYFMEASFSPEEYHEHPESFAKLLDFLSYLGWFKKKANTYQFTDKGLFFAKRAAAYGVTVSYIPTFRQLDELIFGNPNILASGENEAEQHVDRAMNVWGSGGAHAAYFKKIDQIVIDIFNRPIDEQPKGILDMGCGNGAFLIHLYELIEKRTKRGEMLEEHPLFLVGVDYNQAALKVTRANIIKADIWAKVIWGDIGDPQRLHQDLQEDYNIQLHDLLNVRTFLDHNRVWEAPTTPELAVEQSASTGAYAYKGKRINNKTVEHSLKEHLSKWKPYVERFGLLVIELHTLSPSLTAQHIGCTAATAYDATHGFSDQYILELHAFAKVANEIGLYSASEHTHRFPDSDLATVSIHYLKGKA